MRTASPGTMHPQLVGEGALPARDEPRRVSRGNGSNPARQRGTGCLRATTCTACARNIRTHQEDVPPLRSPTGSCQLYKVCLALSCVDYVRHLFLR